MQKGPAVIASIASVIALSILSICSYFLFNSSRQNNIVIVALAKSGSTYTTAKLAKSLQYKIAGNDEWLDDKYMKNFNKGKPKVLKMHINPSQYNLDRIRKHTDNKIVVLIRDPRAASLSRLHHLNQIAKESIASNTRQGTLSPDIDYLKEYLKLSLTQKKELMVNSTFKNKLQWIEDWCAIKEVEDKKRNGIKIEFVTYESLLRNESVYFKSFYHHFDIKDTFIKNVTIAKNSTVRFRSGKLDEWRQEFTTEQIARMNKSLPQYLLDRFGWER